MLRIEFHPGEGGTDAELFARELADSVKRYANLKEVNSKSKIITLTAEHCL